MTNYEDTAAFGSLCDAVAYRRLIAVTGSGVSVGLPNADSELPSMPTWYSVLIRLRERFAVQLGAAIPELDVLRRRYGLACIFVDSFEEVRSLIGDAGRHLGPRLRHTIAEALHRVPDAREYREQRRAAHIALSELSRTGARTAAAAFRATAVDSGAAPSVRAEAAYCLGKIRPTVTGTAEFLLSRVERDADPEIATFALAALLQLEPPVDKRIVAWTQAAQALMPICDDIDRDVTQLGPRGGRPRARKYLDALLARWNAMYANEYPNGTRARAP